MQFAGDTRRSRSGQFYPASGAFASRNVYGEADVQTGESAVSCGQVNCPGNPGLRIWQLVIHLTLLS